MSTSPARLTLGRFASFNGASLDAGWGCGEVVRSGTLGDGRRRSARRRTVQRTWCRGRTKSTRGARCHAFPKPTDLLMSQTPLVTYDFSFDSFFALSLSWSA